MVEPGRSAAVREARKTSSSSTATMKKKKLTGSKPDKDKKSSSSSSSKKQSSGTAEPAAAAESPSYRLALKSLFSCRNSHAAQHQHQHPPDKCKKQLGCSTASICKLKDSSPRVMQMHRPPAAEVDTTAAAAGEPCKRRASVSGSSERVVKKPLSEVNSKAQGGSSTTSSSSGGSSFRAGKGMQLRRLSGCYECHMVVDPLLRDSASMRATIFACPDCAQIFVRAESLHLHQSISHAVSELGPEDTSRNIIEIIFQSSWLKKQSPVCVVDRILKVHNAPATLAGFEDYRDTVKARASTLAGTAGRRHPRCTADGNELLRFHCATLACSLGLHGATHLCDAASCAACGVIRDGFKTAAGVRTMATSGRAHDAVEGKEGERRAMLVCRVIAGRVKRAQESTETAETTAAASSSDEEEYDSVGGSAGVYSNLEELEVFNPTAILPCFVVVYKA